MIPGEYGASMLAKLQESWKSRVVCKLFGLQMPWSRPLQVLRRGCDVLRRDLFGHISLGLPQTGSVAGGLTKMEGRALLACAVAVDHGHAQDLMLAILWSLVASLPCHLAPVFRSLVAALRSRVVKRPRPSMRSSAKTPLSPCQAPM